MPWTQKQMLRDANGDLIPQYWDVVEQEFKPLTGSGGANDVRLTGSIVEYETFFEREVRTESTRESRLYKPEGAKGFIAYLIINGVSGTFNDNEGICLRYRSGYINNRYSLSTSTKRTNRSNRLHVINVLPSISDSDVEYSVTGSSTLNLSVPLQRLVSFAIEINGDFENGEGIDCEVIVQWIF